MARMPKGTPTAVIHADFWSDSESCTIKTYVGTYDRKRIEMAGMRVRSQADNPTQPTVDIALHEAELEKLCTGIISWTFCFDDEGTEPIPCDREHIALLDARDADFILDQLNAHWDSWRTLAGEHDAKSFRTSAALHAAGTATEAANGSGGPAAGPPLHEGVSDGLVDVPESAGRAPRSAHHGR